MKNSWVKKRFRGLNDALLSAIKLTVGHSLVGTDKFEMLLFSESPDIAKNILAGFEDLNGKMNDIQKVASASSYAKRYGLLDALGIATGDTDDDGNAAGTEQIDDEQIAAIDALVTEIGLSETRVAKFLKVMKADQLGHIAKRDFRKAIRLLEAARARGDQ